MSTVASPSPNTVTLALPVVGWLVGSNDDTIAKLYDAVSVIISLLDLIHWPLSAEVNVLAILVVVVLLCIATSDS